MNLLCDKCKRLCNYAKTNCMRGKGLDSVNIMIIGEYPDDIEDQEGRVFIGRYSKFIKRQLFLPSAIDEKEIYFTYAIKCALPKGKKPTVKEMRNCREYLFEEIKNVNPKVIIVLGNVPVYSVLYLDSVRSEEKDDRESGMSGITKWRGKKLWHKEFNCWVIPALSPSSLMRVRRFGEIYPIKQTIEDFELALKLSYQKIPNMRYPKTFWVKEKDQAIDILVRFKNKKVFAVDTETEGFNWWNTELYGMSLSSGIFGYYFDFQILDFYDKDIFMAVKELMSNNAIKIMHNSTFDVKVFYAKKVKTKGPLFDTMMAAHLIDENFYKGLKPLTWRYLNFGGYDYVLDEYRREYKLTKSFSGIPGDVLSPYAAYDAVATYQLYELFSRKLKEENLDTLKRSILIPARKIFTEMEIRGVRVDYEKVKMLGVIVERLEKDLKNKIWEVAGDEFNLKSPKQKQELFFKKLKMRPLKETASSTVGKKSYSTDSDSLKYLVLQGGKGGEIAGYLMDYSYLTKQHSTFIDAIIKNARKHRDGNYYMHTNYNMTGTVTLRISCYNPCTHNIPNDGLIKSLYIPRPGRVLCYADVNAAEMRVLAVYTKEPKLLKAFRDGRDVHTEVWRLMFDKGPDDVPTTEERRSAKRIVFGLIYGMSVSALAKRIEKPIDVANDYIDRFFTRLPNARKFFEKTYDELLENGYITTLFNSRRRLPAIYGDDGEAIARAKRQSINTKVQTVAAVFTYIGVTRIDRLLKKEKLKSKIVHSIHDCVMVDTLLGEKEKVAEIIKDAFEKRIKILPIKMKVDVKYLENWGQDCDESRIAQIISKVDFNLTEQERGVFQEWIK